MFTLWGRGHQLCDGFNRREFLRVGALGLGGLTMADLLRHQALGGGMRRPKSVIYIVLSGGVSHLDTWDPKPEAPIEYRGEFASISTRLPGVGICELMPRQAAMLDKLAVLRGVRSVENDHFLSEVYTGLPRTAGKRPAFGSVVSRVDAAGKCPLPPFVSLREAGGEPFEFENPHYAGAGHAAFRPFGEALQNLAPVKDLPRLENRRDLLAGFSNIQRKLDQGDLVAGLDRFQQQALEMITAPAVRQAFDIKQEPAATFERYGRGKYTHQADYKILYDWDPKPFILARRLVEAGVRVVTLQVGSWDHHSLPTQHIFKSYRHVLPVMDQNICALVSDLQERGLGDDVLVVVLSEFGRTPKIGSPHPGREHWADAGCVLLAGGGLRMGQVIGQTDRRAERSTTGLITFQNLMSTIYHVLGVDPTATLPDFNGRPQYLLDDPQPIRELLG